MIRSSTKKLLVVILALTLLVFVGFTALQTISVRAENLPEFVMAEGAGLRFVGDDEVQNGIRFSASMDTAEYEDLEKTYSDVKYGIVIIPKDYVDEYPITEANLFGENAVYVSDVNASTAIENNKRAMVIGERDTLTLYKGKSVLNVAMTNIKTSNLLREYIGTPYIAYKAEGATVYTYKLGSYYGGDVANNTRSMTFVAQKAIEDGQDTDGTIYKTYVEPVITYESTYKINRYFENGYGEYVLDSLYGETVSGTINSVISTENSSNYYLNAFTLNAEKSDVDATVYANGKREVNLYYDLSISGNDYHGFNRLYSGVLSNLTDGDVNTKIWTNCGASENSFIVADLGAVQIISGITVQHTVDTNDTWTNAKVEYSADGKTFVTAGTVTEEDFTDKLTEITLESAVSARFIRVGLASTGTTWIQISEISVTNADIRQVTYSAHLNIERDTKALAMIDGDEATYAWFSLSGDYTSYKDANILLDLGEQITVFDVHLLMAKSDSVGDYFHDCKIEYSTDGSTWTEIGAYSLKTDIKYSFDTPVQARYLKATATSEQTTNWIVIREFGVNKYGGVSIGSAMNSQYNSSANNYYNAIDGDTTTYIALGYTNDLSEGYTVTFNLGTVTDVFSIYLLSGDPDGNDKILTCTIYLSTDGVEYTAVGGLTGSSDGEYKLVFGTSRAARYIRFDFKADARHWVRVTEFYVNSEFNVMPGVTFSNVNSNMADNATADLDRLTDGDETTYVWFSRNSDGSGRTLTLNLGEVTEVTDAYVVSSIKNAEGETDADKYHNKYSFGGVAYSEDGVNFITLTSSDYTTETVDDRVIITFNTAINAKYVRFIDNGGGWLGISELGVNANA